MLTPKDLSQPQRTAIKDILNKRVMCITSDCGFGKTVVGLSAFSLVLKKKPDNKALIVCTPKGVKETWSKEHVKWSHLKHLRVVPLLGSPKQRLAKLNSEADVYVITYQNLAWLLSCNMRNFNFVFADEGDCLKGPASKWRKSLLNLAPNARWRIISSATPKTREEDDYWGLCKYLDNGACLKAPTITEFRRLYMREISHNGRRFHIMDKKSIPIVEDAVKHLFVNYELSDNATVPIKTFTAYAKLTDESQAMYDKLEREQCLNSITDVKEENLDSLAISAKLDQLSSGFVYVDDSLRISTDDLLKTESAVKLLNQTTKRKTIHLFNDRINAFVKLINNIRKKHNNKPVVICYHYTHEKVQLLSAFPNALTDTDNGFVERWNTGKFDYLLLQYSRSSKSLNLQQGSNIMAFYSLTFKWVDDYQIIRRLARQGQPEPYVCAYRLHVRGTIDDVKTKRLNERFQGHKRFQSKILKRLKDEYRNI